MVYNWGNYNIVVDPEAPAYQNAIGELMGNKSNGFHKERLARPECFIKDCKRKHLPF